MPARYKSSRTDPPNDQEICEIVANLKGSEYLSEAKKHLMILALYELLDRRAQNE